ncbi:MAG: MaoC family dehydratase N-terminal domain-containing protein [Chloroflexi bacterium]|nr:MaoC family dehydratase N-terminal domain-containing protein [Chloroflexota bacterium]
MTSSTTLISPEVRALVGYKTKWRAAVEPVSRSEVRRFAVATYNQSPLHLEEAYAERSRWGVVIAPPTFAVRGVRGKLGSGEAPEVTLPPDHLNPATPRRVNGGNEMEVFRPVQVGDEVRQRSRLLSVTEKSGRSGPFVLMVVETVYVDQRDLAVRIVRHYFARLPMPSAGGSPRGVSAAPLPEASVKGHYMSPEDAKLGAKPLSFEAVEIEQQLPANEYGAVTSERVVRFSAAVENYEALHHDFLWCREHGFPNVLINGPLKEGLLATYAEQLAGEQGFVRKLSVSHRAMDYPGDILTAKGTVSRKEAGSDGLGYVDVDIWLENQRGERSCPGQATVVLQRRGGPAVPTAFVCPPQSVAWAMEE